MELTAQSSAGEVLMHHPLREHYDDIVMNPHKTWFGAAGPWEHVLPAQDRVILRRHISKFFPDLAALVDLRGMGFEQLSCLIEEIRQGRVDKVTASR